MTYYENRDGARRSLNRDELDDLANVYPVTDTEARTVTPANVAEAYTLEAALCRECGNLTISHAARCPFIAGDVF